MSNDLSDTVRDALGRAVREAVKNIGDASPPKPKRGTFSGAKGLAAGAGLAAAAPLAKKGFDAVRDNGGISTPSPARAATKMASKAASKAGDKVGSNLKDAVSDKVDEAGGAGGLVKDAASGLLPGIGGDSDGGKGDGMPGVGKGRRMPVQQSVDVAVPLETAYNQWTQFEDWPEFMHRVTRVTQEDDCTIGFATKIWGKTKEFTAQIETQRPEERIKWRVSQGITHTGVVTFHELAPNLTRIELTMDIDPGSLLEKAARGMRHIKRAVRADLHRYKAFIEVQELETGAWRGVIEDGELVEPHDDDYDEERDYSEVEDIYDDADSDKDEDEEDKDEDEDDDSQRGRTQRFKRQAQGSKSGGGSRSRTAAASRSSSSRSASGSGGSRSGKSRSSGSGSGSRSRSSGSGSSRSRSGSSGSGSSRSRSGSSGSGSSRSRSGSSKSQSTSSKSGSSKSSSQSSGSKSGSSRSSTSKSSSSSSRGSSNGKARTSGGSSSSNGRTRKSKASSRS